VSVIGDATETVVGYEVETPADPLLVENNPSSLDLGVDVHLGVQIQPVQ
jgi:hypothetical protein